MFQGPKHTISNVNRPSEYNLWIQGRHNWDEMLDIDGLIAPQFSSSWWLWWKALQPSWRSDSLSQDLRSVPVFDWSQTRKGSQNSLFTVILVLGWWILGVQNGSGAGREQYTRAMSDVSWAINQMTFSMPLPSLGRGYAERLMTTLRTDAFQIKI